MPNRYLTKRIKIWKPKTVRVKGYTKTYTHKPGPKRAR